MCSTPELMATPCEDTVPCLHLSPVFMLSMTSCSKPCIYVRVLIRPDLSVASLLSLATKHVRSHAEHALQGLRRQCVIRSCWPAAGSTAG